MNVAARCPADGPGPVLSLERVGKTYPGNVVALRDASLRVMPGEFLAVVGPSGSGKSTMLHLMGALDLPTSGLVRFEGHDVASLRDRQLANVRATRIGFVFQEFHLTYGMTVLDNVADGLLYAGVPIHERRDLARDTIRRVGLEHRITHRPHQLSGGERQRVAIARAVLGRPALVLADEPTGNLDSAAGEHVLDLLRELNADGVAVVIITHDGDLAAMVPRRVTLFDGQILRDEDTVI